MWLLCINKYGKICKIYKRRFKKFYQISSFITIIRCGKSMKIIAITIFVFITSVWYAYTTGEKPKRVRKYQEEPTNNLIFEKLEYELFDSELVPWLYVDIRPVASNILKINVTAILNQTVNEMWGHAVLYKKYLIYQKYLVDVREDVCEFFELDNGSPVAKVMVNNILRILPTKISLRCPFHPGTMAVCNDRFNFSEMFFPLMPAGRYRLEITMTKKNPAHKYVIVKLYFAISDFRVWF